MTNLGSYQKYTTTTVLSWFTVGFSRWNLILKNSRWTWESSPGLKIKKWLFNYCLKDSTFKIFCNFFLILIWGMIKIHNLHWKQTKSQQPIAAMIYHKSTCIHFPSNSLWNTSTSNFHLDVPQCLCQGSDTMIHWFCVKSRVARTCGIVS